MGALKPPAKGQRIIFDKAVTGLGVKVLASGRRTFILRYTEDGKRHEARLGDVAHMTLSTARKKAVEKREGVLNGESPPEPVTLSELITAYCEANQKITDRTRRNYEYARDHYLGDLKNKKCATLKPDTVEKHLNDILKKGKRAKALATARTIRAAWKWGAKRYGLPKEPPTAEWQWPTPPKRKLDPLKVDSLSEIWAKIEKLTKPRRALWKAFYLTGARPGSLTALKWEDVDLKKKTITFREAKGGEDEEYAVPIGPYLAGVFEELKALELPGEYVFPSTNEQGFSDRIKQTALKFETEEKKAFAIAPVDARKTYQTLGAMTVPAHAIRLLVNHALPANDVASNYVQFHSETLRPSQELIEKAILKAAGVELPEAEETGEEE